MANKKEFKIEFRKSVNDAWCGYAFYINRVSGKCHSYSFCCAPGTKARTARSEITEAIARKDAEMAEIGWERCDEAEYDEYYWKNRGLDPKKYTHYSN